MHPLPILIKYNELMEYLFGGEYPLFTHIKMEMGNDGNNSTGAEAYTMRYEDEEARLTDVVSLSWAPTTEQQSWMFMWTVHGWRSSVFCKY